MEEKIIKLDIGCGPNKKPGFIGVDILPLKGVDVIASVVDLQFEDNYADEIRTRRMIGLYCFTFPHSIFAFFDRTLRSW